MIADFGMRIAELKPERSEGVLSIPHSEIRIPQLSIPQSAIRIPQLMCSAIRNPH